MEPWRRALGDLRAAFQALAGVDLWAVVVREEKDRSHLRAIQEEAVLEFPPEALWAAGKPVVGTRFVPRFVSFDRVLKLNVAFYGEGGPDAVGRFAPLAAAAFRCLRRAPQVLPGETDPALSWLLVLVELALERRWETPLVATAVPFDPPPGPVEADRPHYVRLPDNLFLCSTWGIDLLVNDAGRRPGLPEARDATPASTKAKARPSPADDRRDTVRVLIQTLADNGLWNVSRQEIMRQLKIPRSTFFRYLDHPKVKPTWARYRRDSLGKKPAHLEDLGD
jgi:hypothetical protein